MEFFEKVKELQLKGKSPEEIAHILGTDVGRVRVVMNGGDDPDRDEDEYLLVDDGTEEDELEEEDFGEEDEDDEDEAYERENNV